IELMQWDGASWNQAQPFPVGQTEYAKVAPVKGEHHVNPFTVCQVYQRCIGKLYPQAFILGEDRGNPSEIRLAQSDKLKGAAMERGQEFPNRQGVCTQKPCRFGNHGSICISITAPIMSTSRVRSAMSSSE